MLAATSRGTFLKAEFTWIIRDTFKWPVNGESLNSPLFYPENDERKKWTLKIKRASGWDIGTLSLFLCLSECPTEEPKVTTRFSITVSDEKKGNILYNGKFSPISFTVDNGNVSSHKGFPIGYRKDYLNIPSVLIRVSIKYEIGQLMEERTTPISSPASPVVSETYYQDCWRSDFENLFTSKTGSDISFIIDGQETKAHKLILSARSPVFSAMFNSEMKEKILDRIDFSDISLNIFNALLRFIYTDRVQLTDSNVEPLLAAADKYLLSSLKSRCEEFLINHLTTVNCIEMMTLADLYNALRLKKVTQELFSSRHTEIRKTEGWKALKKSRPDVASNIVELLLDL